SGLIISALPLKPVDEQPGCPKVRMAGFSLFIPVSVHDLPPIVFSTSSVWERRRCANQKEADMTCACPLDSGKDGSGRRSKSKTAKRVDVFAPRAKHLLRQ